VERRSSTVIIALLGLFVMRINLFNGIAISEALTVFMVMVGSVDRDAHHRYSGVVLAPGVRRRLRGSRGQSGTDRLRPDS
ncbi:MAG: hypothetical protein WAN48_13140, partial [Actinomycetes bacterium]